MLLPMAGLLGCFLPAPLVSVVQAHALCPTGDQPKAFPSLIVLRVAGLLGGRLSFHVALLSLCPSFKLKSNIKFPRKRVP